MELTPQLGFVEENHLGSNPGSQTKLSCLSNLHLSLTHNLAKFVVRYFLKVVFSFSLSAGLGLVVYLGTWHWHLALAPALRSSFDPERQSRRSNVWFRAAIYALIYDPTFHRSSFDLKSNFACGRTAGSL